MILVCIHIRLYIVNNYQLQDEPTNHLDASSVSWLEIFLHDYKGAVIAITHDRYFLDNVAHVIAELDRGNLFAHQGNYSQYLETRLKRRQLEAKYDDYY